MRERLTLESGMGRPTSSLPVDKIEPALAYLQRALDRGADFFTSGSKETRRSLSKLRQKGLTLRRPDFATEANAWLTTHVTAQGRRCMLVALRQRRAAEREDGPRHTVRLTAAAHADVMELAERLAVPAGTAVALLAQAVLADPGLVARLAPARI